MKRPTLVLAGLLLAVLGGVALVVGGVPYTEQEQIVDMGPIEASAEIRKEYEIPPLVGGIVLAAGVGLAVYGSTRRG